MPQSEIRARHYRTGQPVLLRWDRGAITRVDPDPAPPPGSGDPGPWIAPALFDLQVNGFAGVDFQRDDLTPEGLLAAARGLLASGCSRFLLTLVTAPWPRLTRRLAALRDLRSRHEDLRHAIAGWHIEGPFLSEKPGYAGAHDAGWMLDPDPKKICELRAITGDDPMLLTLAPERPGALEAIREARSAGIRVSLGHTDAPAEILGRAVAAGAAGFTHLGNACPQQLDRHDNILWRVLDTPGLTVSLIPDRIHVAPALFRLIHRSLGRDGVVYTTDAMAAAGAAPGRYTLGALELEVGADQVVRQPGRNNFAGSALQPIDGVRRAAEMLGCDWQDAWDAFSTRPAAFLGIPHGLAPGCPADFCLVQTDDANQIQSLRTYARGLPAVAAGGQSAQSLSAKAITANPARPPE